MPDETRWQEVGEPCTSVDHVILEMGAAALTHRLETKGGVLVLDLGVLGLVESALLLARAFPPPSTFTLVLVHRGRPGAGGATHRTITLLVKSIRWDVPFSQVGPDVRAGPIGERVELKETPVFSFKDAVSLDHFEDRSG